MQNMEFSLLNDDLLQNILSKLPATSFAFAAVVSKDWNAACSHILSRPKLSSAISLNPLPLVALQEVFDEVMSEPIRPHFAIASFTRGIEFEDFLPLMVKKLGSRTPIIVSAVRGILGREVLTHELVEVKLSGNRDEEVLVNPGIMLTVGFVPGLKVDVIPLVNQRCKTFPVYQAHQWSIDKFVLDIKNYTFSASGSISPPAIILIGNGKVDKQPIVEKLDYAIYKETIIVGDEDSQVLYRSSDASRNVRYNQEHSIDAVALVFARDRNKAPGIGNIEFHFALSNGISTMGPKLKVASVIAENSVAVTNFNARREGQQEILNGDQMLEYVNNEMGNVIDYHNLYIGVKRLRSCYVGSDKFMLMTSLVLHAVIGADSFHLLVDGVGISTGNDFQFYRPDPKVASSSSKNVASAFKNLKLDSKSSLNKGTVASSSSKNVASAFKNLKLELDSKNSLNKGTVANVIGKKEVFGGFMFVSIGGRELTSSESSPFLENFPGVPLAGTFCRGEIGRGYINLAANGEVVGVDSALLSTRV